MSKPESPNVVSLTIIGGTYVVTVCTRRSSVSRHVFDLTDAESAQAATPGSLANDLRRWPALAEAVADLDVLAIAHALKPARRRR